MRILETLFLHVRKVTAKISNSYECTFNNKDTKTMAMASIDITLVCQYKRYLLQYQIFILCCKDIFFYVLVFNVSRFSRLCSQARFITKQKEIDVKSVYLNLGSDKVQALPVFHTFSGTDIKGSFLIQGKKNCWQFFKE